MNSKLNINYKLSIKIVLFFILISIFTYTFYFSLTNIINYWSFTEFHINYSLGFSKRGLLGSLMLWLENLGIPKNIFFSTTFYLITLSNIFLFLNLLNRFKKNHLLFYIFFSLNPALLLFSFYDLGGYARGESFGIFACLLHVFFAQKLHEQKITYERYLKFSFLIIFPIFMLTVLIHELNILFLSFHIFTVFLIINKNQFKKIANFKYLIICNFIFIIFIALLLITHPFTRNFAQELYNTLPNKNGTSFWILDSIAGTFSERINSEINHMLNPSGAITLYISIFLFYIIPIFFLLTKTTEKNRFYLIYVFLSVIPFFFLFFIGRDWGRWIHIISILIFFCLIQFKEKKMTIQKNLKSKILTCIFVIFIIFQLFFTRIPHCCNLTGLNLNVLGGIVPKLKVFYKILNNKYDIEKRFKKY